ncbi:hypothetical protein COCCADRAFT_1319 [Bipolaris zeicola 26-R-13]|uniref:Uncharacterized protein n=1 Tax=Cochliobolus carbonum (strain 26-R-13) TaxID=930089 RepID=W6YJV4_COCC2|nr:uncharacterized protein COCCADRAFT_1319 [Bipolaris zeicola 26-R-13]EUC37875.1 hypothetical protein COCCADRAFT_1319 [Bipolaris zeicola 26-R-13]
MASPKIEATAKENNDELKTLIVQEIQNCRGVLNFVRLEWQNMKQQEDNIVKVEKKRLDEAHKPIKQQECTYNEVKKLLEILRTNHSVQLVHDTLLVEQKKEAFLIEESFNAIKIPRVKLREENSRRTQVSKTVFERETRTLERIITKLQQMAETAGIFLDDVIIVEQNTSGFTNTAENVRLSPAAWSRHFDAVIAQGTP